MCSHKNIKTKSITGQIDTKPKITDNSSTQTLDTDSIISHTIYFLGCASYITHSRQRAHQ